MLLPKSEMPSSKLEKESMIRVLTVRILMTNPMVNVLSPVAVVVVSTLIKPMRSSLP